MPSPETTVVIGAGMGGLAAAIRLAAAGEPVTLLERHGWPGGKMRTLPSSAGPIDTGPTVLTMRHVFDDLFSAAGTKLEDHVPVHREPLIARHYWRDGTCLDLWDNRKRSAESVRDWGGPDAEADFLSFAARAERLYEAFKGPMMETAAPSLPGLITHVLQHPSLVGDMGVGSLSAALKKQFRDPRLAQLFGRYATYVGGHPGQSPAVLSLIAHSEAKGVWRIEGGLYRLARAMAKIFETLGGTLRLNAHVRRIEIEDRHVRGVTLADGQFLPANAVVFNGDPQALRLNLLGKEVREAVPAKGTSPRSLSAYVHAFAATVTGPPLAHHTVFFGANPEDEFGPLSKGEMPTDPTLYICAQDRAGVPPSEPNGTESPLERFEIILNGPPKGAQGHEPEEIQTCQTRVFETLTRFGLTFSPMPDARSLTTPTGFHTLFPGSDGSLYGRSPHGLMAAFNRPTARTSIPGLFLAGGGAHPGAGIPMATLSGKHAAEAILTDPALTSRSRQTATRGGTSTDSRTMVNVRSPSSAS